ncbi:hypothetical protein [Iodobacter fluviatilis]|uniref:META domain n=1 Tax=Iodobacter fluviatilis TaxID=537 RepID=A0A377SSW2_9NEIS|nr:hypothetical protein [Iodobacter fluviatilis]TCU82227.1 hypothetical protein EV682_11661 [Iodobacter fluviatilis]STR45122.1 Uncharacterised protein [Iodobacter fluviatilis]
MQTPHKHHNLRQLSLTLFASLALSLPAWGNNQSLPKAGQYNANNKLFERTLVITESGQFSLEVSGKSAGTSSRSGSGEGKLKAVGEGWLFNEGNCQMHLTPAKDGLLMQVDGCAGNWGDVMFNGLYQYGGASAASKPAASNKPALNPKLAKTFNCQNLEFNNAGIPVWLAQMANLQLNQVFGTELKVTPGYTFQGLPVQSAILFESEIPFLAMLVDADKTALTAAVKKAKQQKNAGVARLRKNGELSTEGFAGKGPEALYISCAER